MICTDVVVDNLVRWSDGEGETGTLVTVGSIGGVVVVGNFCSPGGVWWRRS
jgi:hypothetical protein